MWQSKYLLQKIVSCISVGIHSEKQTQYITGQSYYGTQNLYTWERKWGSEGPHKRGESEDLSSGHFDAASLSRFQNVMWMRKSTGSYCHCVDSASVCIQSTVYLWASGNCSTSPWQAERKIHREEKTKVLDEMHLSLHLSVTASLYVTAMFFREE